MTQENYVGFYWTLPVPWAGFSSLDDDVDQAADQSRTIRYQRDLIRRWVKNEHGVLIAEKVFLELAPDRATELIEAPLKDAVALCRNHQATFVYVDFQLSHEARPHRFLQALLGKAGVDTMPLPPEPESFGADGQRFDPIEHFRGWRAAYQEHLAEKPAKSLRIKQDIYRMREEGLNWTSVATWLDQQGLMTLNGKPWSPDNARKFARS